MLYSTPGEDTTAICAAQGPIIMRDMNQEPRVEKTRSLDLRSLRRVRTQWLPQGRAFFSVVRQKVQDDALSLRAMGLTYVTLLSLVPLLAAMFAVLKAFGVHNLIEPSLAQALEPLGEQGAEITRRILDFVSNLRVGVLGAVGVAALFYTVVSLISKIEDSFNYIWQVRHSRTWGKKCSDYLSVVLVGPVLVFTALTVIASAQSHTVVQYMMANELLGPLIIVAAQLMPFAFLCIAFTFLYVFVPNTAVRFGSALLGGVVAAVLWQLAGVGFAAFIAASARYAAIYSSFAILVFFFIWVYASWLIILVGAEVACFHQHPNSYRAKLDGKTPLSRERLALTALAAITRRYLAEQAPWSVAALAKNMRVQLSALEPLIDTLLAKGVLLQTVEPEGIVPGRPPEQIAVASVLAILRAPGEEPAAIDGGDAVSALLDRRNRAVEQALDGITLRSLATDDPLGH